MHKWRSICSKSWACPAAATFLPSHTLHISQRGSPWSSTHRGHRIRPFWKRPGSHGWVFHCTCAVPPGSPITKWELLFFFLVRNVVDFFPMEINVDRFNIMKRKYPKLPTQNQQISQAPKIHNHATGKLVKIQATRGVYRESLALLLRNGFMYSHGSHHGKDRQRGGAGGGVRAKQKKKKKIKGARRRLGDVLLLIITSIII